MFPSFQIAEYQKLKTRTTSQNEYLSFIKHMHCTMSCCTIDISRNKTYGKISCRLPSVSQWGQLSYTPLQCPIPILAEGSNQTAESTRTIRISQNDQQRQKGTLWETITTTFIKFHERSTVEVKQIGMPARCEHKL